jgi:hypothetical protein
MRKLVVVIFLLATQLPSPARAAESFSCTGTKECSDLVNNTGNIAVILGATLLPHWEKLLNTEQAFGENQVAYTFGEKNLKEMHLELQSLFKEHRDWRVSTDLNIQLYDKTTPSVYKYGVGGGYNFKLDEFLYLTTLLKASVEQIETLDPLQMGPEIDLKLNYSINGKLNFKTEMSTFLYNELNWRFATGLTGTSQRKKELIFSSTELLLTYQENRKLQMKTVGLSFGYVF